MTSVDTMILTCACCAESSEYTVLRSTNSFGSPDLDLRPPPMERDTMELWVQHCPVCDYCAEDITDFTPQATEIISSTSYKEIMDHDEFPELAKSFLMQALLVEPTNRKRAAKIRLQAAWDCDDKQLTGLASECRQLAIDSMKSLHPFSNDEEGISDGIVYIDMLRRTGQFNSAIDIIKTLLAYSGSEGILRQVLDFEQSLCEEMNSEAKKVSDISNASS